MADDFDAIAELCAAVKDSGATMKLNGVAVDEEGLRDFATESAKRRILDTYSAAVRSDERRRVLREVREAVEAVPTIDGLGLRDPHALRRDLLAALSKLEAGAAPTEGSSDGR